MMLSFIFKCNNIINILYLDLSFNLVGINLIILDVLLVLINIYICFVICDRCM